MSARHEVYQRAKVLRSNAAARASKLAGQWSTLLSRLALVGVLALPFVRPAEQAPAPRVDIVRTRPVPAVPASPPAADPEKPVQMPPPGDQSMVARPPPAAPPAPGTAEHPAPTKPLPPSAQPALPWTPAEIASATAECARLLDKVTLDTEALPPAREGACGAPAPRELRSIGEDKVKFEPPATLTCPMIAALNTWVTTKLQPAAQKSFGSPVVRINAESYSCRNRYGLANAPISEHAFMNAVDVSSFALANGKIIRVSKAWGPTARELDAAEKSDGKPFAKLKLLITVTTNLGAHGAKVAPKDDKAAPAAEPSKEKEAAMTFLHEAHNDACQIFGTVLGPDTNEAHRDHFHLDMRARKNRALCQ